MLFGIGLIDIQLLCREQFGRWPQRTKLDIRAKWAPPYAIQLDLGKTLATVIDGFVT